MKRRRAVLVALVLAVLGVMALGTPPASAAKGDRPVGVADVKAHRLVLIDGAGAATVAADVRCKPGWEPSELDILVSQADGSYASGFTIPSVPCDGAWRTVSFVVSDSFGTLYVGKATVSAQLLVTNVDSGDSAGAHSTVKGRIRPA